jgi:hypothetical protein
MGAPDVPTLYSLQKVMGSICNEVGNPTEKVTSTSGNVFYINDIAKAITKVSAVQQEIVQYDVQRSTGLC